MASSSSGPEVGALEQAIAGRVGVRHAIACASGTDALVLALLARDIGAGDAVFVPAFTFVASAEAVALAAPCRCWSTSVPTSPSTRPASARRSPRSVAMDRCGRAPCCRSTCSASRRVTRSILPIARERGLFVLQDAAQSFGACWRGEPVGRQGDAAALSFYPSKPLGAYGDGGAVLTDDDAPGRSACARSPGTG